ncbi:MAG: diphthine synthase [Candidatus Nanohaloarchaea archaeon]
MLYIIGLGLDNDEITQKGLEALEKVDQAYAEFYTNTANIDLDSLPGEIEVLEREQVEQEDKILETAEEKDIAFLVSGDPLTATTHYDIKHRAEEKGLEVQVVHAPSIFTSIAETGLNVYKFGRTVTLPREGEPESIRKYVEKNDSVGLHSLVLLDIDYDASEAAEKLLNLGLDDREALVVERANHDNMNITLTSLKKASESSFGATPHSIILTGEKSFKEEEFVEHHG